MQTIEKKSKKDSILLATTSLERTWGRDEKILFLGEWCKLYHQKNIWKGRNAQTLKDPWSNRDRRFNAHNYVDKVYKKAMSALSNALNQKHNLNYPERYWLILCGPWLRLFINTTYFYWECLSDLNDMNKDFETIEIKQNKINQVPIDMQAFEQMMVSDRWVHYIITLVIKSHECNIHSRIISQEKNEKTPIEKTGRQKIRLKSLLLEKVFKVAGYLFNKHDSVLLLNTYLTKIQTLKLGFNIRSLPSFSLRSRILKKYNFDNHFRKKLNPTENISSGYEAFLYNNLLKNIPFMYVEGFEDLNQSSNAMQWPELPLSIVTASDHWSNDIFKCYSANKFLSGSKLNILCHGGGGKYKYSDFQMMELDLCDNYFTWGWSEYSSKCTKGFFIKDIGYKRNTNRNEKHLLHIILSQYRFVKFLDAHPTYEQYIGGYLEDQFLFNNKLDVNIKSKTITKLSYDYENSLESRFNNRCSNINFSRQGDDYNKLLKEAKIVIATYNCTTPVESIAMNIPTIIFWDERHWELAPSAIPFFDKLRKCGVFHSSPESAAIMANKIWSDVDTWWQQEDVQEACSEFRAWFARESKNPIKELSEFCIL